MSRRLLFAEDNPEDRIPVAKYLRDEGWDVVEVFNPAQAKASLQENLKTPFDAIILDLVMPEKNPRGGEEVLEFMHQNNIRTPVILATAWGYNGPAQRAKAIYPEVVKKILCKTFRPDDLMAAVEQALAK